MAEPEPPSPESEEAVETPAMAEPEEPNPESEEAVGAPAPTEPEEPSPETEEAAGPPAAAADAAIPAPPPPEDAAAAGAPVAAAPTPPAESGAPVADSAAPAEPPELTPPEKERVSSVVEVKLTESERANLEEMRDRELQRQRKLEEEKGKRIICARLHKLTEYVKEEIQMLEQQSLGLQKRVIALQKKRKSAIAEAMEPVVVQGEDEKYYGRLTKWNELKFEFGRMKEDLDKRIDDLRYKLYEKTDESNARHEGLIYFLWKKARESQDMVSYQGIPRRVLHELEQEERDSIAELQAVRTSGRAMKKQLAKLELRLALKDRLPTETGYLHLVKYENLEYDNEALKKKIIAKDEVLAALKAKTAYMVHTLQHIREKHQYLVVECKERGQEAATIDKALHGGRIKNSLLKTSILTLNRKRNALTKGVVSIRSAMMCDDMDYQRQDIQAEEQRFRDLKKRYYDLSMKINEFRNKMYDLQTLPDEFAFPRSPRRPLQSARLGAPARRDVIQAEKT